MFDSKIHTTCFVVQNAHLSNTVRNVQDVIKNHVKFQEKK